jgi:hypothetical protein
MYTPRAVSILGMDICAIQKFLFHFHFILLKHFMTPNAWFVVSDLYRARLEFESMKKQAESVTNEYDRLLEEHAKLQVCSFLIHFVVD